MSKASYEWKMLIRKHNRLHFMIHTIAKAHNSDKS